jgi:hypothetical protein
VSTGRWRRLYPRAWRDRYGAEYDQLLSDLEGGHLLPTRSRLDHYRFGVQLRVADPAGRRCLLVLALVALLASGLGLFASTLGGSGGGTYTSPSLLGQTSQSVGSDYFDAQWSNSVEGEIHALDAKGVAVAPDCPSLSSLPLGVGISVASTPPPRTDQEVASGNLGTVAYQLDMPTLSTSPSLSGLASELAAIRVSFDRHSFAFCPEQQFFQVAISNLEPFPFLNLVVVGNEAIAYGFAPSLSKIRLSVPFAPQSRATGTPRLAKGPGALSFFVEEMPGAGCEDSLNYRVLTPEYDLTGAEYFGGDLLIGCTSFEPMSGTRSGIFMGGSPRSCGTVASLSSNSLVLDSPYRSALHVIIPEGTPVYLDDVDNNSWTRATASALARGSSVYVSGRISTTTAVASTLFIDASCGSIPEQ